MSTMSGQIHITLSTSGVQTHNLLMRHTSCWHERRTLGGISQTFSCVSVLDVDITAYCVNSWIQSLSVTFDHENAMVFDCSTAWFCTVRKAWRVGNIYQLFAGDAAGSGGDCLCRRPTCTCSWILQSQNNSLFYSICKIYSNMPSWM